MDNNKFLQAVLRAAKGDLIVSSARLQALPAFLASAVEAINALSEIFGLEHVKATLGCREYCLQKLVIIHFHVTVMHNVFLSKWIITSFYKQFSWQAKVA